MNHSFIIERVIENHGIIVGSYVREWLGNGSPVDFGWEDIDIKCPIDKIQVIKNKILKEYPNIRLDFMPCFIDKSSPALRLYTCDFFKYDGDFKILEDSTPVNTDTSNWLEFTKNKIYYGFLEQNEFYKRRSYEEQRLNNLGWKFAGLNKFNII